MDSRYRIKEWHMNSHKEQGREGFPVRYEGEYRDILNKVFQKTWLVVLYVVFSTALVYFLSATRESLTLFVILQLPFIIAGCYVLWPNQNIRYRVPIGWITTALLLYLVNEYEQLNIRKPLTEKEIKVLQTNTQLISIYTTLLIICILIYSIYIGITWTYKSLKSRSSRSDISVFLAMWGATLQMVQIAAKIVLPTIKPILSRNDLGLGIVKVGEVSLSYSVFGFVPVSLFLLGILIFVSFAVSEDPYNPVSFVNFTSIKNSSHLYNFTKIALVPFWIIFIILGFVTHLLIITSRVLIEFTENYIPRVVFIVISLVLGPVLFFIGHKYLLISTKEIINYISIAESKNIKTQDLLRYFVIIHGYILLTLSVYFISICLTTLRYRGETPREMFSSIFEGLFNEGKDAAIAVTQVFSLMGILIVIIPITSLIPGGPGFGAFSWVYTAIMTIMVVWTYVRSVITAKSQKNFDKKEDTTLSQL